MKQEYLIYGHAVALGFIVYFMLDRGLGVHFTVVIIAGLVAIHAGILPGRRYL